MQKSIAKLWMSSFLTQTVCILKAGSLSKTVRHLTPPEKRWNFLKKKSSISAVASQFPRRKSHRKRLYRETIYRSVAPLKNLFFVCF